VEARTGLQESRLRQNFRLECAFNAFNGVFMGTILYAAQVFALKSLNANQWHVTILTCAFPCGAFLGPHWAKLGQSWGMQKLVLRMAIWANVPLFIVPFIESLPWFSPATWFAILMAISQLGYSAMRMGQSSLYHATYPREVRGRVLGWLVFWNFITMVLAVLFMGYMVNEEMGHDPGNYRWLCPIAAIFGLGACLFYVRVKPATQVRVEAVSLVETFRQAKRVLTQDHAYRRFQLGYFLSGSAFFLSLHVVLILCEKRLEFSSVELALWLAVIPQVGLALTSPIWGRLMDRLGIEQARLFIASGMTVYLLCYLVGIVWTIPLLVYIAGVLRGVAEGGGQVTWALASVQFAPTPEQVPTYNGIHFWLNGVRGLLMPWIGTQLFVLFGAGSLLAGILVSAGAIVVVVWSLKDDRHRRVTAIPPHQVLEEEVDSTTGTVDGLMSKWADSPGTCADIALDSPGARG
jgi:MFS family permease